MEMGEWPFTLPQPERGKKFSDATPEALEFAAGSCCNIARSLSPEWREGVAARFKFS
jgi:hypothetical protein